MKLTKLLLGALLVPGPLLAQEDTEKNLAKAAKAITSEFPSTRVINIEYNQSLSRNFESELYDRDFQNGRIKSPSTLNISANLPFYVYKKKWIFSTTLNYQHSEFDFGGIENVSPTNDFQQGSSADFHNYSVALNTTYIAQLFGKPIIYNGSIIADGNNKGFQRIKGMIVATMVIKKTARTTMSLGLLAFIDPASQIPAAPLFSYNHKFSESPWEFDLILPQRVLLRRPVFRHSRLSFGAELAGNGFYVNVSQPTMPSVFQYRQAEIRTGAIYEHKLSNSVVLTVKGGLTNFVNNRLTEKGVRATDYIYKNTQNATGYFNVGLSLNPFAKMMAERAGK